MAEAKQTVNFPQKADQVGIVVRDIEKAMQYYTQFFGIGPFRRLDFYLPEGIKRGKKVFSLKMKLAFASLGAMEFELIEAPPGDNIYREFLEKKGEGLHHIGFHVSDIESYLASLKQQGIGILFSGKTERAYFAYLDTEEIGGVIFELVQRYYTPPKTQ